MIPVDQWSPRAACRHEGDPELFFLPRTDRHQSLALAICADCPVQADCRDHALNTRQEFGIWGGLTEDDRQAIWRQEHEEATA